MKSFAVIGRIIGAVRTRWRIQLLITSAASSLFACYLVVSSLVVAASLVPGKPDCGYRTPIDSALAVEAVSLETSDGVPLAAWLIRSSSDRAVILIHGLGSFGWDAAAPDIARELVGAGFHVLVLDLRGHGRSGGAHLGLGWVERQDLRAAVDLLLARGFDPGEIGLHGTSYGAATALLSAAIIPEVGAVVADSAFADVRDVMVKEIEKSTGLPASMARFLTPGLSIVAERFYGLDLELIAPARAVTDISPRPILFIHGGEDRVVPPEHAFRLMAVSTNGKDELWILPGLGHTEAVRRPNIACEPGEVSATHDDYLHRVTAFFDRSLAQAPNTALRHRLESR